MRKLILIALFAVFLIAISVLSLFGLGLQFVSTNKDVYSVGENVIISWSDFRLMKCTCSTHLTIYQETENGWKSIMTTLMGFGAGACVDGTYVNIPMPCDLVSCNFPSVEFKSGNYTWNSKFYERVGQVDFCESPVDGEMINMTMNSYEFKTAPPGRYKATYGLGEKIFEIK
jgi:hypothetical protein